MTAAPPPTLAAAVLGALALLACARLLWWQRRAPSAVRARPWRLALLLAAQPAWAVLLFFALHPPARSVSPEVLVVLTAGSSAAQARDAEGIAVALPEAPPLPAARRVPDLATALRLYPQAGTIRVVGDGLPPRDRDALGGRRLRFEPPPAAPGLAALAWPAAPVAGDALRVSGRAEAVPGGRVELLDPAGVRVDAAALDVDGGFRLDAPVFAVGPATFRLRLLGADGARVEEAALPVSAQAPPAPRLHLLAGAPNAETRFLRRWATDAGLPLRARVALGGGMALGDAAAVPDARSLAQTDVLVIDARAWGGLGAGGRAAVLSAVEAGMGLIVRADAPPAALPGLWTPGFRAEGGAGTVALAWPQGGLADLAALRARLGAGSADAPFDADAAQAPPPALVRRALRVAGADAVPLGADATGAPWAWWRPHGLGRVLVWTPQDSYRLVLAGRADLHAELWREAVAAVARPRAAGATRIDAPAFVDERVALCGLGEGAEVEAPDGHRDPLWIDPRSGDARCAGFWPRRTGWHRVVDGAAQALFHVFPADALPGVRAAALREATAALACTGADCAELARASAGVAAPRGPAWPWWLAWLALAGALWAFERSRFGRRTGAGG